MNDQTNQRDSRFWSNNKKANAKKQNEERSQDFTSLDVINIKQGVEANMFPFDSVTIQGLKVKPREIKSLGPRDFIRTPWIFSKSAFRLYKPDDQNILDKCFENDWSHISANVAKFIKDEAIRENVKALLKNSYKCIKDAYKYTVGQEIVGNLMSIGINSFT